MNRILLALIGISLMGSCLTPPDYPVEPIIKYVGMTRNSMKQSAYPIDSTSVTISYTDGDGDLGDDNLVNVTFIDKRNNIEGETFKIPFIPQQGAGKGISGDITFKVHTTCCDYPDWSDDVDCQPSTNFPVDTLVYEIYIKDRAGHESNHIQTAPIYLLCQ